MSKINWQDIRAKREYDCAQARIRRARNLESSRAASRKWHVKHPYVKQDPAIKRQTMREAAIKRWDARRKAEAPEKARQALVRDFKLLALVIDQQRRKILRAERNRVSALAAYHKNAETINERRRRPQLLSIAFRGVLREQQDRESRLIRLGKAFRKVLIRSVNRAEQKIRKRLCSRFERAMKTGTNSTVVTRMAGTSFAGVRAHLESLFRLGMTWDNHGYGPGFWNIDHIKPLASFGLSDPEQARQAFHYTNLQPLWHEDNMKKSDKIL
jgi:hypothetical protein